MVSCVLSPKPSNSDALTEAQKVNPLQNPLELVYWGNIGIMENLMENEMEALGPFRAVIINAIARPHRLAGRGAH